MASPNAPRGALSTLSPSQSKQQQQLQADHHHHHDRVVVPMSLRPHGDDGPSPPSKHSDFDWPELRAIRPIPTSPQGELSATSSLEPIRGAQVAPDTAVPSAPSNLQLLKRRSQSPTQGIARLTRLAEPRHRVPSMVRYPHPPLQAEAAAAIPKPTFVNPHAPVPTVPAAEPPLRAAPRQLPFLARDRSAHRESPHRGGMPTRDLTAVAPRLQHEIDDYDRHRRRAEARSAAVDKRVQMMLREIEKQRESIERVIEKQDMDFEHRLNAQHAQVAADQAARKETVKKRQEAHLERMTKLKVDRRVHAVPPLASGPGRFGPDRSQPTAAAVARGTSIGVQPATSQPYTTDSPLSHAQRSPSPLRQASPTPSPQLVEYAVAPVARVMASIAHEQDTVMAAEERFRRAEAERIEAERALRLAQRRAVATRLLETQRAAAEILQAPLRTVQSFVGYQLSLRAARAAVLRIVQRRSDDAVSSSSSSSSGYGDDEEEDGDGDTDDENLDYQSEPTTRTTADGSPALSTVASLAQMKPTRDDESRAPRRRSVTIAADEPRMEQEEAAASADGSSSPPHLFSSGTVPPHIMESLLEKCSPVQRGGTPVDSSSDSDPDLADARETEAQLCLVEILEFALLTRMREAYSNMNAE